jgi:hypothetical protein
MLTIDFVLLICRDDLNPKFVRPIVMDYRFEEVQTLKFMCYDIDDVNSNLQQQDYIGEVISLLLLLSSFLLLLD